jgi:branched-chain amino acid transport system permease protein
VTEVGRVPRESEPDQPPYLLAAVKEAAISAVVAFGLFALLIGVRTDQGPTGALVISTRFGALAEIVAAVFVGRLLWMLTAIRVKASLARLLPPLLERAAPRLAPYIAGAFLVFALIVPIVFYGNSYMLGLATMIATYTMLGLGLNIVVGLAGLLDLGYVAFYAVGAYSYALLSHYFGLSFWACLPLAGILAAFAGLLLGFPVLRLRGDYLAIVTLGFGEIIRLILLNWQSFTGGPNGMFAPNVTFFGIPFTTAHNGFAATFGLRYHPTQRAVFLYCLILALLLVTNWFTLQLRRLPIGRAWEALREDEVACRALGINTTTTKLTAFAMGAMFGGFAGAFFATRLGFISPESFTFTESALVLAIVVLGGMGSQLGVAVAATVMLGGFELFREFDQYRMLVFGAAMVAIVIYRPRGLVATRTPSVSLREHKDIPAAVVGAARTEAPG